MTYRTYTLAFTAMLVALATMAAAAATTTIDEKIDALQPKFEQRYPELRELKKHGVIGETFEGFVAFVKEEDPDARAIVKEENADRRVLYELIAEKEQTTPDKVAERNARRNFRKAEPGEYLRDKNGKWTQKEKDH